MKRLVVELTDRCNLACTHCFEGRHGGRGELPLEMFERVLVAAHSLGIGELSFTGGEPTLHRDFPEILRLSHAAGYSFGLVTNGWTFPRILPHILVFRDRLTAVTFSVDGAAEATHDRQRGKGSYMRVIDAARLCAEAKLPFTFNFVISAHNAGEMGEVLKLARGLGASGIRFIPYLRPSSGRSSVHVSSLSDRLQAGMRLLAIRQHYPDFNVGVAPGFFTADLVPCHSLRGDELNLAWNGQLDLCCHLSGHVRVDPKAETFKGDYAHAAEVLAARRARFVNEKRARGQRGVLERADYFACDYCVRNWLPPPPAVGVAEVSNRP